MQCVGADVYRKGWVAVVLRNGRFEQAAAFADAPALVAAFPDAAVLAFDIPIGLPQAGTRAADREARQFVGRRSSSVFNTPPRYVLEAPTYTEARRVAVERWGKGVSSQSYRLGVRILEVDALAAADRRVVEVHPEVSFRAMAGRPLQHYKKTWNGQMERRLLLLETGIELPDSLPGDAAAVPPDDVLDAAAAAWSAARRGRGEAVGLPDPPETRADGGPMAIWY